VILVLRDVGVVCDRCESESELIGHDAADFNRCSIEDLQGGGQAGLGPAIVANRHGILACIRGLDIRHREDIIGRACEEVRGVKLPLVEQGTGAFCSHPELNDVADRGGLARRLFFNNWRVNKGQHGRSTGHRSKRVGNHREVGAAVVGAEIGQREYVIGPRR
jgi:hypothetical protein